jgi:hypothetical protein
LKGTVLKKDRRAQLLLVTCILLTLALLTVAMIAVQTSTRASELSGGDSSITMEYNTVKLQYGEAVNALANQKMRESTIPDYGKEAITISVGAVSQAFRTIEARHGLAFDASFDPQTGFLNNQNPYHITVTISLSSENTQIVEEVEYTIMFEFIE